MRGTETTLVPSSPCQQRPYLRRRFCVNVSDSSSSLTILFIFWQKQIISVLVISEKIRLLPFAKQ